MIIFEGCTENYVEFWCFDFVPTVNSKISEMNTVK